MSCDQSDLDRLPLSKIPLGWDGGTRGLCVSGAESRALGGCVPMKMVGRLLLSWTFFDRSRGWADG
jgi:hypothetical protein